MDLGSRNKINAGFSMSSMTDLVFLLLIFFIIVSTLISPYALPVDLPVGSNKTKQKPNIAVRIDADLFHSVNNKKIEPAQLEDAIKQEVAISNEAEPSIVLHVDQSVPTGTMVKVLDMAKRNRWKIVLATKPK